MRNLFKALALFSLFSITYPLEIRAQEADYQLDIATSFHENMRSLGCGYAQEIRESLSHVNDDELKAKIETQLRAYQRLMTKNNSLLEQEARLISGQIQALQDLRSNENKPEMLRRFAQAVCEGTEKTGAFALRSLSHALNVAGQLANLPFRMAANFIKGLWSGDSEPEERQDLTEFIGVRHYKKIALFSLYKASRNVITGPTWFLPIWASPVSEYFTAQVCQNPNDYNENERRFCANQEKTKGFFHRVAQIPKRAGAWLGRLFGRGEKQEAAAGAEEQEETISNQEEKDGKELDEEERFCSELMDFKEKIKENQARQSRELFGLMLNPGQFSRPERFDISVDSANLRRLPEVQRGRLKNVVISLAPNFEEQEDARSSGELERFEELNQIIAEKDKVLRHLFKARSVGECEERKEQKSFSAKEYNALAEEKASLTRAQRLLEHGLVQKQIESFRTLIRKRSSTNLHWEIIEVNDIRTIHQTLKRGDIGNVVIVTHGRSNGKIVDSQFNELPSRFFAEISPSIMSLGFYQCHSQKVLNTYNLREKFSNTPSYHKLKHIFFVEENDLFGSSSFAPIVGFKDFFAKLDAHLYRSLRGSELLQSLEGRDYPDYFSPRVCSMNLGDVRVEEGSLRLMLNRKYLDTKVEGQKLGKAHFPCSFLQEGENVLVAQSANLKTAIQMDPRGMEFSLNVSGADYQLQSLRHFTKPGDDSYASSKITFEIKQGDLYEEVF